MQHVQLNNTTSDLPKIINDTYALGLVLTSIPQIFSNFDH